jgi:glycerate 2-kinase
MFTPEVFLSSTLRSHPRGGSVARILAHAFNAVEPGAAVKRYLHQNPLPKNKRIFALGLGKAACAMTDALPDSINLGDALIITKHASRLTSLTATVIEGDHPIPGDSSLAAGRAALEFVSRLTPDDLLICLLSGGGSALMAAPVISLPELQSLTSALLASGARIDEVNTLRRHLDNLKGGGLAHAAHGAQIVSLILSDVVGDAMEAIASGPTAPDPSTREDAIAILQNYELENKFGNNLRETTKLNDDIFKHVQNHIIASNYTALKAAQTQAEQEGFSTKIITDKLQGEAREVGRKIALDLKEEFKMLQRPFCLLAGGETTVTLNFAQGGVLRASSPRSTRRVNGEASPRDAAEESAPKGYGRENRIGKGGRNQELILGTVEVLRDIKDVMIISIATDGEDGPTDAAGAVASGDTAQRAESLGLAAAEHLSRNDAYVFFDGLGDLIKTGPSGTNVNDIVLCIAF